MRIALCVCALWALFAMSTSSPVQAEAEKDYFLDDNFTPSAYDIKITLPTDLNDLTKNTFTGEVTITVKPKDDSVKPEDDTVKPKDEAKIRLHRAKEMDVKEITYKIDNGASEPITKKTYDEETEIMEIDVKKGGTNNVLHIKYTGHIYDDMYGIYRSAVNPDGSENIITTQFQQTFARRAFPCFDEPKFKATYKLTLTVGSGYTAISNQDGTKQTPPAPGTDDATTQTIEFKPTPKMSTYLIAFVVSKFKATVVKPIDSSVLPMRIWAPEESEKNTKYAAEISRKIIDKLGKDMNKPFSDMHLDHLDQVAIPDFAAGAMENWGLVTYRETALLWNEEESRTKDKERVGAVIAHEFAHSWFGNWVTTKTWDTTWLNEGFARYFEYHVDIEELNKFEMPSQFVVNEIHSIMDTDGNENAPALNDKAKTQAEIKAKFGTITYSKGGTIVRMMEKLVGKDNFLNILKEYIKNNELTTATPEELYKEFKDKKGGKSIKEIVERFTTHSGYPVVTVSLNKEKKVVVQQKKFTYHKEADTPKEESEEIWNVPLAAKIVKIPEAPPSAKKDTPAPSKDIAFGEKILSVASEIEIIDELKDTEVVIVNQENQGYYRVNYDATLWERIIKLLKTKHTDLSELVRAQLIDDAMNLARAGQMEYKTAMDLLSYLEKEESYYPWRAAFTSLSYLRKRLVDDSLRETITEHMAKLMKKFYEKKKTYDSAAEPIAKYTTILALEWACELDNKDCTDEAKKQFELMFPSKPEEPAKPVVEEPKFPSDLHSITYCSALRHSTDETKQANWDKLWEKFKSTKVVNEKITILTALGCTKDKKQLEKYLEKSLTEKAIRKQDAITVFKAVLTGNPEGVAIAFDFLNKDGNIAKIAEKYGSMGALSSMLSQVADRLTSQKQVDKFGEFITNHKVELGDAVNVANNALNAAKANMKWAESYKEKLNNYFYKPEGGGALNLSVTSFSCLLGAFVLGRMI